MSSSPRPWVFALLMLTPAIWSVNYLVARGAAGIIEPHTLASGRWLLAALLLSLGHWGSLWQARSHLAEQWLRYAVLGALGMWICGAWVYIAGRTTSALNIALIYSVAPVLIVVSMWLYTLVFAFSGLWFIHYALAALQAHRARAALAPGQGAGAVPAPSLPGPAA